MTFFTALMCNLLYFFRISCLVVDGCTLRILWIEYILKILLKRIKPGQIQT